jgi:uncharacterized membrane protein YvbJ
LQAKGGGSIDKVAYEVVISVVVLALLITVIAVFRGNMDTVQLTAQKVEQNEKVKLETLLPLAHNEVTGSDVVSVIRYYKNDGSVTVRVIMKSGLSKTYFSENYISSVFPIPYEGKFTALYVYSGEKLSSATFTEK